MNDSIKTKHGEVNLPAFFPTVGWPGGKGEYDNLFSNLEYFCRKINHYQFLFNFSSFALGWTIPDRDFNPQFQTFQGKDIRDILKDNTNISVNITQKIIVLLDIGGNRIFNKIIHDKLEPTNIESYAKYLDAYQQFLESGKPDIFVNFDVGPSYTTKDNISKKGVSVWGSLSTEEKSDINRKLLDVSIKFKNKDDLIMVPVNATHTEELKHNLEYLFSHHGDHVNIVGIAGIANQSKYIINKALYIASNFRETRKWNVIFHGLGLGGWQNIPLLVKYGVESCDVASPWRRACTDVISHPYLPLLDKDLNFTNIPNAFAHYELYNEVYSSIECGCPFCEDLPLKEVRKRCMKADKRNTGDTLHSPDFREMRIRVYFHNVFQHIALLKRLHAYKLEYGQEFLSKFCEDMPAGKARRKLSSLLR